MDKQNRAARKKHHVIYKTTCLKTGRYYIGMHSTDDLADGYIGSGKRLWQSIKKHGVEQHVCEVLEHLPSRAALRLREAELVDKELLKDERCMNLTLGGDGGWVHCNSNSEMQRAKCVRGNAKLKLLRADPVWSANTKANIGIAQRNAYAMGTKKPTGFPSTAIERSKRPEAIEARRNAMKGRFDEANNPNYGKRWIHNLALKQSMLISNHDPIPDNWLVGRKMFKHL